MALPQSLSFLSTSDTYRTLASESRGIFKDRGSKFIAIGLCVSNEDDIKRFLEQVKVEFHDARHHCYAWRLGINGERTRANDDGEPSSSAGKPILGQLVKHDISNAMVIVVRYFGGVKLGVGGLINAYKSATADLIMNAKIIEQTVTSQIKVKFQYDKMSEALQLFSRLNVNILQRNFEHDCEVTLDVPLGRVKEVHETIERTYGLNLVS